MNKKAFLCGYYFAIGYFYATRRMLALDEEIWRTSSSGKRYLLNTETGKIEKGYIGQTTQEEKNKKIQSVKIDFLKEVNELPRLNKEDLELYSLSDKPVTIHQRVLQKHPEVKEIDVNFVIGNSLYNPELVLPGNAEKPYINFISSVGEGKNTIALLDVEEGKDSFEIVNFHWIKDRQRKQKIAFAKRVIERQKKKG